MCSFHFDILVHISLYLETLDLIEFVNVWPRLKQILDARKQKILEKRFQDSPQMLQALGGIERIKNFEMVASYENLHIYDVKKHWDTKNKPKNKPFFIITKTNIIIGLPIRCGLLKKRYKHVYIVKGGWNCRTNEGPISRFWYVVPEIGKLNHSLPSKIEPKKVFQIITKM